MHDVFVHLVEGLEKGGKKGGISFLFYSARELDDDDDDDDDDDEYRTGGGLRKECEGQLASSFSIPTYLSQKSSSQPR